MVSIAIKHAEMHAVDVEQGDEMVLEVWVGDTQSGLKPMESHAMLGEYDDPISSSPVHGEDYMRETV